MVTTQPNLPDWGPQRALWGFPRVCGGCPPEQTGRMVSDARWPPAHVAPTGVGTTVSGQPAGPCDDGRENPPETPSGAGRGELLVLRGTEAQNLPEVTVPPAQPSVGLLAVGVRSQLRARFPAARPQKAPGRLPPPLKWGRYLEKKLFFLANMLG